MTESQAININKAFNNLKLDSKRSKMRSDSLSIMFDKEKNNFSKSLENATNAYMLSEEENQMLRETHDSLKIGRFAQDISVITLMFTLVMLIKISTIR